MKKIFGLMLGILVILVIVVITKNTTKNESAKGPIVIGAIVSKTGFASAFGEMNYKGMVLAVEEINKDGGINGRQVKLIDGDDRTDPKTAVGLFKKLTSVDHVDAIAGGTFDFSLKPMIDLAKESNVVLISPMNSRVSGDVENNANTFLMLIDLSDIIKTLDPFLAKTPYTKMGIVRYSSSFGKEITKTLNGISQKAGKGSISEQVYTDFGTTNWKSYVLKLKADGVDLVFADMLQDDFIRFLEESRRLSYHPTFVTHNDVRNALVRKDIDLSILDNVIVVNWDVLGSDDFVTNFKKRFGVEPVNYASQSYMTIYVLAQAIANNGKDNLSSYLGKTTFKTPEGKVSFNKEHSITYTPVKIQLIKDGVLTDYKP